MSTITLEDNEHDTYRCHNCDYTFSEPEPRKGFGFRVGGIGYFDDDNDFFIPGSTKVVIGEATLGCHNEEGPCWITDDQWTHPVCQMWKCSCGSVYTFDNDFCTSHSYSTSDDAKRAARGCCSSPDPDAPQPAPGVDKPVVGDKYLVTTHRPEGAAWNAGTTIVITEVGDAGSSGRRVLRGHAVGETQQWNVYNTSVTKIEEQPLDDYIADKFTPKNAEKKVTVIEFD